jgi:integrating conjugative element membrane protein (TIGR03747 family)
MAVSTQTRKYSKKLILNLLVVLILGWGILFSWAMSLWVFSGFDQAFNRTHQLASQQMGEIVEFSDELPSYRQLDITRNLQPVSNKVDKIRDSFHEKLESILPANDLFNNQDVWNAIQITKQVWLLVGLTTHVMLIKLTILLAAIPLFALTMIAGLVDGLNQRFIRTASLGRESSYLFHRLNHYFKRGLLMLLSELPVRPV